MMCWGRRLGGALSRWMIEGLELRSEQMARAWAPALVQL